MQDLVEEILRRTTHPTLRLVCVDGRAGSGKSTFAARLGRVMQVPVMAIDDFSCVSSIESWWPRLQAELLEPLFRGENAHYQERDWIGDVYGNALGNWKTQIFHHTMILEGVGSSRLGISDRIAFTVWIETPRDLCFRRGVERDSGLPDIEAIWTRWQELEDDFIEKNHPQARADQIISGAS